MKTAPARKTEERNNKRILENQRDRKKGMIYGRINLFVICD